MHLTRHYGKPEPSGTARIRVAFHSTRRVQYGLLGRLPEAFQCRRRIKVVGVIHVVTCFVATQLRYVLFVQFQSIRVPHRLEKLHLI